MSVFFLWYAANNIFHWGYFKISLQSTPLNWSTKYVPIIRMFQWLKLVRINYFSLFVYRAIVPVKRSRVYIPLMPWTVPCVSWCGFCFLRKSCSPYEKHFTSWHISNIWNNIPYILNMHCPSNLVHCWQDTLVKIHKIVVEDKKPVRFGHWDAKEVRIMSIKSAVQAGKLPTVSQVK